MTNSISFFITGSNGFIGSKLVNNLQSLGNVVKIPHEWMINKDYKLIDLIRKNESRCNILYILGWGATSGEQRSDIFFQKKNIDNMLNLLEVISNIHFTHVIYTTTIAEFEGVLSLYEDDEHRLNSIMAYGLSKLYVNMLLKTYCYNNNIAYTSAYITNCFGPGEISHRLIYTTIKKLKNGQFCSFSKGDQLYDFVYINDVVSDLLDIMRNRDTGKFLIGSGCFKPLRSWLEELCDIFGKNNDKYRCFGQEPSGISIDLKEYNWIDIDFYCNLHNKRRTFFRDAILKTSEEV